MLTQDQTRALHWHIQRRILDECRSHEFPLAVQSTALCLFQRLSAIRDVLNLNHDLLRKALILLSAKCENTIGDLQKLIFQLNKDEQKILQEYEELIASCLDFKLHVASPYTRIVGYIVLLQERGRIAVKKNGSLDLHTQDFENFEDEFLFEDTENKALPYIVEDVNVLWKASVLMLDKILLLGSAKQKPNVQAAAALKLPLYVIDNILPDVKIPEVVEIRKEITSFTEYSEEYLQNALETLKNTQKR